MDNPQPPLLAKIIYFFDRLSEKKSTVWFLFFLALATRLVGTIAGGTRAEDDDHWHLQIAQNFLKGNGLRLDTDYGPTYSYIQPSLAIIHIVFMSLFSNFVLAERIFLLLFSSLTIVGFYFLCTRFFSKGCALLSALILTLYPPQWFWMTRLNPHSFGTNTLVFCLLLFYIAWEKKSFLLAFAVGLSWGLLTQFRPEYELGIFCLALASLLFFKVWKDKIYFSSLLIIGWMVFLAPWVWRNYKIQGYPVVSTTHYGINLWMVFNPNYKYNADSIVAPEAMVQALKNEPNEVKRARIYVEEAKKNIRANPRMALERVSVNFLTYWRPWLSPKVTPFKENLVYIVSYVPIFILFLIGMVMFPWRDPKWLAIGTFFVYKVLAHLPFYMIVRFREATMPVLLLIATLPLRALWNKYSTPRNDRPV